MNVTIRGIAPNNKSLEFLEKRIADDNYCGSWPRLSVDNQEYKSLQKEYLDTSENQMSNLFKFSKGIDYLLHGRLNMLLELFTNCNDIEWLTIHEFMFFVSAIHTTTDFNIDFYTCDELLNSYRKLTTAQHATLIELLNVNIDFISWLNIYQSIFDILGETVYFEKIDSKLLCKIR